MSAKVKVEWNHKDGNATWLVFNGGLLELSREEPFYYSLDDKTLYVCVGKHSLTVAKYPATPNDESMLACEVTYDDAASIIEWARIVKFAVRMEVAPGKSELLSKLFGRVTILPETIQQEAERIRCRLDSSPSMSVAAQDVGEPTKA